MVFSYDHGKCEMARALRFEDFGELFSVQAYGSLVYRCAKELVCSCWVYLHVFLQHCAR